MNKKILVPIFIAVIFLAAMIMPVESVPVKPKETKVTGGGFIIYPAPSHKSNFGFEAMSKDGKVKGHIEYIDKVSGIKLHGNVLSLTIDKVTNTAIFSGIATINGKGAFVYKVTAVDKADPGKGKDTFAIDIPAKLYTASGKLAGGNIQVH